MTETRGAYQGKVKAVEIRAEVRNMKTMADHSVNLTLNIPEDNIRQAQVLLSWIGDEIYAVLENKSK